MLEGLIIGVLLFAMGLAVGGGGVWVIQLHHDRERIQLYVAMGALQGKIALLEQEFGDYEPVSAKDLGLED